MSQIPIYPRSRLYLRFTWLGVHLPVQGSVASLYTAICLGYIDVCTWTFWLINEDTLDQSRSSTDVLIKVAHTWVVSQFREVGPSSLSESDLMGSRLDTVLYQLFRPKESEGSSLSFWLSSESLSTSRSLIGDLVTLGVPREAFPL